MKKLIKNGFWVILGLFLGILFPLVAQADYQITAYQVQAQIQPNGSLSLQRKITYDFDDEANGVYYRQNLASGQKLSQPEVKVNGQKTRNYELDHDQAGYRFKVYHHTNGGKVTFTYNYVIEKAVINWQDTAELNFKIIGDGWEESLHNVQVKVSLPKKQVSSLQAWVHGPLSGYNEVNRSLGYSKFKVARVPAKTFVEIHMVFDKALTAANPELRSSKRLAQVRAQEAKFAKEANAKRRNQKLLAYVIAVLGSLLVLRLMWVGFVKKPGYGPRPLKKSLTPHVFEPPTYPAAEAQALRLASVPDALGLSAHLLELVAAKKLKLEELPGSKGSKEYRLTLVDFVDEELIGFLFKEVGDGKSFTTQKLRRYGKRARTSQKINDAYSAWQEAVYTGLFQQGYLSKTQQDAGTKFNLKLILGIVATIFSGLGIFFLNQRLGLICLLIWLPLELMVALVLGLRKSAYTVQGAQEATKLNGLYKMLDEIGNFRPKEVGDIVLWETLLPYATAFGLSEKVVAALKTDFSVAEFQASGHELLYYSLISHNMVASFSESFDRSFEQGLTNYSASSSSSSSGSSGGFSGGNSGGFGGGSGGGAF
ncbi:DUF2207 domain-containing protein [Ligilactobacillus equi]